MADSFTQASEFFQQLQRELCTQLARLETGGGKFIEDKWQSRLGAGCTNILQGGEVLEKAGVAFSNIAGSALPAAASKRNPQLAGRAYRACGISVVIHPRNPYVPASHANFRMFMMDGAGANESASAAPQESSGQNAGTGANAGTEAKAGAGANAGTGGGNWWFGGGFDLTPYYIEQEDCDLWHRAARTVCDAYDSSGELHSQLKQACDDYFYLPHREETRGIGGIFFDDFNRWEMEKCLQFVRDAGNCYKDTYISMIARLHSKEFGQRERDFQLYRRGRYVEFNLLYDRGTLFGLESGGRTESILMSLPPKVSWVYDAKFDAGSPEQHLQRLLHRPRS